MKALSLTQPWAMLVALGEKQIETRSWGTRYRGPLAIHAAKALPKSWAPFRHEHFIDVLEPLVGLNEQGVPNLEKLPRGAVLALVGLVDVVPMVPPVYDPEGWALSDRERAFGDYGPGRHAWIFEEPVLLEPIPYKGSLGLWDFPLSLLAEQERARVQ